MNDTIQLGTTFTSIMRMILDRKDTGMNSPISSEPDTIYLPRLARHYIKLKQNFIRIDVKNKVVASDDYKWFIWKVLEHAISLHERSRNAPSKLSKIIIFLQAWEEEAFPGMITVNRNNKLYTCYQSILQSVNLENSFIAPNDNDSLQLGNIPVITILQRLTPSTVIPKCNSSLGGKRNKRTLRKSTLRKYTLRKRNHKN